jgi:electron transfer flavoprotein alpha subunit
VLKIAVCIKQIPLVEDANFDPATKTIKRDGPAVISSFDLRAISLAMALKAKTDAESTVITMGPPQARAAIEEALAMGIDRGVHLEDRAFAGSDTLATARALAMWLKREPFDLVLMGKYTLDAETGQVGPEVAELLGIAQITGARKLEIEGNTLKAERESDEGWDEIECAMPALVTCAERLAQPIRVKPAEREAAKNRPILTVRAAELHPDPKQFGFAGSPTVVHDLFVQETAKTTCRFIDASDPARGCRELIAALDAASALKPDSKPRRPVAAGVRTPSRGKDVWVACESNLEGEVTRGSLELLSRGDELATELGGALVAVGFPSSMARHAALLAGYGADRVIVIDAPELASYTPETAAEAFAALIREREPWGVLLPASERGRDWGPRLAARLGLGLTGDAIGIELDQERRMVALKPAFGGNIIAPILSSTYPQMATVRSGMLELAQPSIVRSAEAELVRPQLAAPRSRLIKEHSNLDPTLQPLEGAEVVVGVGIGVNTPEGIELCKELARVIKAGMCATRRVTDQGLMPRQLQVGLTGKAIDARLYFAIAIRGQPNHTVGIKRARTIVAINKEQDSVIFERASFGLVGDFNVLVPALTDAFRIRLGV